MQEKNHEPITEQTIATETELTETELAEVELTEADLTEAEPQDRKPTAMEQSRSEQPTGGCAERIEERPQALRRYINREQSWLKFNERVLEEAEDPYNPLLERLKFVAIFGSNLDEFFMVRVGSLFDELSLDEEIIDSKSGMNAQEQLDMIFRQVCQLSQRLGDAYEAIIRQLEQYQYYPVDFQTAEPWLLEQMEAYFQAELLPLLSPQIINNRHPFPFFNNEELYIGVQLKNAEEHMGLVPVSPRFPRKLIFHSPDRQRHYFILVEDLIGRYMPQMFNDAVEESFVFRVTRNGDMDLDEGLYDEDIDWRLVMEQLL